MTMMCVRCYMNGRRVPVGQRVDKNPPFAFMIYEGESRCLDHIPTPEGVEREPLVAVPDQLPAMTIVREPIVTDNRFVVEDATSPKPAKKAAAKKTAAKKTAQQRKRTKA
jgi:hypothetical protein